VSTQAPAVAKVEPMPLDLCPLCQAPLRSDQSWCLRCGAAARTRLAAQPKWKALVVTFLLVVVLSLGVLAAALVKLAG
jgi:predicted amidophosphoribosyltransferase